MAKKKEEKVVSVSYTRTNHTLADKIHACMIAGIPCCIWGDPGMGKSASVRYLANRLGIPHECVIPSIRELSDFGGLPVASEDRSSVNMIPPRWAKRFENEEKGILFFDEVTTCPPTKQAALLNITLEGIVGEMTLNKGIYRVCAGNFTNVEGCYGLSLALCNRMIHIFHKNEPESWSNLVMKGFNYRLASIVDNSKSESYFDDLAYYQSCVCSFWRNNPEHFKKMPDGVEDEHDVAWASERSWEAVWLIFARLKGNDPDLVRELVEGTVGKSASDAFYRYMETEADSFKFSVYDNRDSYQKVNIPLGRPDICAQIMSSCLYYINAGHKFAYPMATHFINKFYNAPYNYKPGALDYAIEVAMAAHKSGIAQKSEIVSSFETILRENLVNLF